MESKRTKKVMIIFGVLFLLLGLMLGGSITSFVLSLTRDDKILSVLSYFCLILFILFLVVGGVLYVHFHEEIKQISKKGQKKDE